MAFGRLWLRRLETFGRLVLLATLATFGEVDRREFPADFADFRRLGLVTFGRLGAFGRLVLLAALATFEGLRPFGEVDE